MKRIAIALAVAAASSGCAFDQALQNRVSTTLGCDQAFYSSMYGPIGITSKIDDRDLAQMPCAAKPATAASSPK